MTIMKNLLLGTVAGLVAVSGAQAADMPVKAKPVQYVKICSLYGDGFYYIPGTDTCIKMGGYLRVQAEYNMGGGGVPLGSGAAEAAQARTTRDLTNDVNYRTRAAISWDVRQQTEYGTLRTYIRTGIQVTTPADTEGGTVFWDRAFMQFAGFTVGKTQSFFDLFTYGGGMSYHNVRTAGDTGAAGLTVWAYTAQFGNGFSGTLSAESPIGHNRAGVIDASQASFAVNAVVTDDNAFSSECGQRLPDARRDRQPARRSGLGLRRRQRRDPRRQRRLLRHRQQRQQRPSRRQARLGGCGWRTVEPARRRPGRHQLRLLGRRCRLCHQHRQRHAAVQCLDQRWRRLADRRRLRHRNRGPADAGMEHQRRATSTSGTRNGRRRGSAVTSTSRTTTPRRTSSTRTCRARRAPRLAASRWPGPSSRRSLSSAGNGNACSPNFSFFEVGSRTQWNPVPQLDIGLEVLYTHLNTAYKGAGIYPANGSRPAVTSIDDQNIWSAMFRWQRNFYP